MVNQQQKNGVVAAPVKLRKVTKPNKMPTASIYAFWLSIPNALRQIPREKLVDMGYDSKDETFNKLLECQTKTDFAKHFSITRKQLGIWDNTDVVKKMVDEFNLQSNVMKFKKDIDFHFTKKTIKEADAPRVRLWYEIFCGRTPEGGPVQPVVNNIQINQNIIKLGERYDEELKRVIQDEIQSN